MIKITFKNAAAGVYRIRSLRHEDVIMVLQALANIGSQEIIVKHANEIIIVFVATENDIKFVKEPVQWLGYGIEMIASV